MMAIRETAYPYLRGDGVPVASPLFQGEGGGSIPTSPLQFEFKECDVVTACQLVSLWHSRLPRIEPGNANMYPAVFYVAEFDEGLFATAIWSQPVARLLNGRNWIELRRFAISPQAPRNTASRMLSWMVKDIRRKFPKVERAISYQDTEVHHGTIYKASGWTAGKESGSIGTGWNSRPRNTMQSTAPKVRWEYPLVEVE